MRAERGEPIFAARGSIFIRPSDEYGTGTGTGTGRGLDIPVLTVPLASKCTTTIVRRQQHEVVASSESSDTRIKRVSIIIRLAGRIF
jgi:hypothetical protein